MLIGYADYNGADSAISTQYVVQWSDLAAVLKAMPLHLKASDQRGIVGTPIFDPVGTNEFVKRGLDRLGWSHAIPIHADYSFLGIGIDHGKAGVLVEAQFSNYPFLMNNLLRGETFYKARIPLLGRPTGLVVIITKGHMFPASNSTLYYEQAVNQLNALANIAVFSIPLRLVGLFERRDAVVTVKWTQYHSPRYSRTVVSRANRKCEIRPGPRPHSRCRLRLI